MAIIHDTRELTIKFAPDNAVLAARSVTIQENISRLFHIEAELSSESGDVDFDKIIAQKATVQLAVNGKDKRYFNGVVSKVLQLANVGTHAHYRVTIVPWLWLLTRMADCRIFQEKTAPQIIKQVFSDHGFDDVQDKLTVTYKEREYCVQYRETDFSFVSRLMEEEGIYYYFEHADGKHTLVLADAISAHKPFPGYAEVIFDELQKGAVEREVITDWTMEKEAQPVACALNDFDFKKPKASLRSSANVSRKYGLAQTEIYDYPGKYLDHDEGQRLSDVRLEELQTQYEVLQGLASARGLAAGCTFELKNHPNPKQDREYLITNVTMRAEVGEFASSAGGGAGEVFSCSLSAIDKTRQFRPARHTPRPVVQGPQTAIVCGMKGEEIYTDAHARVKVQFHWDRYGKSDENSSCWIRVSQFWAGKGWGSVNIPRIGQEVIVEFLEGDPDRPIITGRVYNADQIPPYSLPGKKTQSTFKSRSSKDGGADNFNEIRFEDEKGSEEVYIHAEKDQNNVVEHDETTKVGHDRTENVDHDEKITIGNDRTEKVGNNESITIGASRTEKVGTSENISIGSSRTENVGANESITVAANRTRNVGGKESITVAGGRTHTVGASEAITVAAAQAITVGADQAVTVGAGQQITVGAAQATTVGAERSATVGKDDTLSVSKKLTITAGEEITIKTGDASIHMKKDGTIEIKGKDITVEATGEINVKASKNITMKGQKILQN